MARGDSGSANSSGSVSPLQQVYAGFDPARPDVPVRVVTEEERKGNSRNSSPDRKSVDGGSRKIGSPFTAAAEARLEKLKALLADQG